MRIGAGFYGNLSPVSQGDRLEHVKNLQMKRRLLQNSLQMMRTADPDSGISQEQLDELELRVEEVSLDMKATMGGDTYATEKQVLSALSSMMEVQEEGRTEKKGKEFQKAPDLDSFEKEIEPLAEDLQK